MNRIPKIFHQIWIQGSHQVPSHFQPLRTSWSTHHPSWQVMTWDSITIKKFLLDHDYPNGLEMFEQYPTLVQQADIARCFILHHFGGVYIDMDFECLRPFDAYLQNKTFVVGKLGTAGLINNGLIASTPQHPVWQLIFTDLLKRFRQRRWIRSTSLGLKSWYVMRTTGPQVFTSILRKLSRTDVHIAEPEVFYPKRWFGNAHQRDRTDYETESLAVHHWHHSWVDTNIDKAILGAVASWPPSLRSLMAARQKRFKSSQSSLPPSVYSLPNTKS